MADLCAWGGLTLPTLTEESQQKLREAIPDYLTVSNPVDNGAQVVRKGGLNKQCIDICLDDPNVDILVCPITGILPSMSKVVAGDIVDAYKEAKKPVIVIWGSPVTDEEGYRILVEGGVPMFRSFRSFVVGLRRYLDYWRFLETFEARPRRRRARRAGSRRCSPARARCPSTTRLAGSAVRHPVPALGAVRDRAAGGRGRRAARRARRDEGVWRRDPAQDRRRARPGRRPDPAPRRSASSTREAASTRATPATTACSSRSSRADGEEVIVGFSNDPQFGPVVLFGLGGDIRRGPEGRRAARRAADPRATPRR